MRHTFPALLALGLALVGQQALAQDAVVTVSDYEDAIKASAARLDLEVNERQKAGDMAAAQRLVLVAAMARRSAEEFRGAEQNAMTDPVSGLPAPIPERIAAALAETRKAETSAAGDPAFIAEAHGVYNALMGSLPVKADHPVLYGLLARDIADTPLPSDIVIYGFRLNNPQERTQPIVTFNRGEVPAVVVEDDRLDVSLPDEVKKAVGFAPGPCESRGSFALRVRDTYDVRRGVWPVIWRTQVINNTDMYALPSPVFFSAKVVTSTQAAAATVSTASFDQKSELATADCGETSKTAIETTLPVGAKNIACTGEWVNASGAVKHASRCVVADGVARASGEITGGVRVCSPDNLCTCPNSAQGFLEIKGSYQIEGASREVKVETEAASLAFPAGGAAEASLTIPPGRKLRHVGLSISRRACPVEVDAMDLDIGDDPEGKASGASKTGAFRASVSGDRLRVGAADAFGADISRTP